MRACCVNHLYFVGVTNHQRYHVWFYSDLSSFENMKPDRLISEWTAAWECVDNEGPLFTIKTNSDAPKWKVYPRPHHIHTHAPPYMYTSNVCAHNVC